MHECVCVCTDAEMGLDTLEQHVFKWIDAFLQHKDVTAQYVCVHTQFVNACTHVVVLHAHTLSCCMHTRCEWMHTQT